MEVRGQQPGQQAQRRLDEARLEALLASRKRVREAMESVSEFAIEQHEAAQAEEPVRIEISEAVRGQAGERSDAAHEARVQELEQEFAQGSLFSEARLDRSAERLLGE